MSDFAEYARSLMVPGKGLIHDYRLGHLIDLSGNGAVVSDSTDAKWNSSRKGYALQCENGGLTVTDQASLRVTDVGLSIVAFGDFNAALAARIIAKRSGAAAVDYDFHINTTPSIFLNDGSSDSELAYDYSGALCLGFSCSLASAPTFYADGVDVGGGDASVLAVDSGEPLYIGERESSNDLLSRPLDAVLIFPNKVLTAEEHAELYRRYMLAAPAGRGAPNRPRWFVKEDLSRDGLVLHIASFDGTDESGEGNNGTRSGIVTHAEGVYGDAFDFHGKGAGIVTIPDDASIQDLATKTICAWIHPRSSGQSGVGTILEKTAWSVYLDDDGAFAELRFMQGRDTADGVWSYTLPAAGRPYHVAVSYDLGDVANDPVFYINGAAVTPTEETTPVGPVKTDTTDDLGLGNDTGAKASAFDGGIDDVRLYNTILSAADVAAIYSEGAQRPVELLPREREPVTLANSTGAPIGPWQVGSGEWALDDDGDERVIECVSAGYVSTPSDQAFGAWRFKLEKADGSTSYVLFSANKRGGFGTTGLNGYALVATSDEALKLITVTNGAEAVVIAQTASAFVAAGATYEIEVVRNPLDGSFQAYIKGGAYTDWTPWGTGNIDTTYDSSSFITADLDAADELSSVVLYPFGGAIDPSNGAAGLEYPTIQNNQSVLAATTISIACPAGSGNAVTILWGDGTSDAVVCDGLDKTLTHNYAATGQYEISVVGDVGRITKVTAYNQAWLSGQIGDLVSGLQDVTYILARSVPWTGDIAPLANLVNLLFLYVRDSLVVGDWRVFASMPSLSVAHIFATSISDYTQGSLPTWNGLMLIGDNCGLSATELDNFLIDINAAGGNNVSLDILTGNGPRSAASDAAVAGIIARGGSVA